MLIAFPTDYSFQKATDLETKDVEAYDATGRRTKDATKFPMNLKITLTAGVVLGQLVIAIRC